jgi:hypothetical protein
MNPTPLVPGATTIRCSLAQMPLGNGLSVRKVSVRYEELVLGEPNIDMATAKYEALKAALAEVEKEIELG